MSNVKLIATPLMVDLHNLLYLNYYRLSDLTKDEKGYSLPGDDGPVHIGKDLNEVFIYLDGELDRMERNPL